MQTTTKEIVSTLNPATGRVLSDYRLDDIARAEAILQTAHAGFLSWRRQSTGQRAQVLRQLATLLRTERERFARLISVEMSKPLSQAEAEIDKCVRLAEWMALHGPGDTGRRARTGRRGTGLCLLPAAWSHSRHHAVEFSVMAGSWKRSSLSSRPAANGGNCPGISPSLRPCNVISIGG